MQRNWRQGSNGSGTMKYPGQKDGFGTWGEVPLAQASGDDVDVYRFSNDRFELADQPRAATAIDPGTDILGSLIEPPAAESIPNALATADPRADLNEDPGFNDSIGSAQAIDRTGLTVTNNPNLLRYQPALGRPSRAAFRPPATRTFSASRCRPASCSFSTWTARTGSIPSSRSTIRTAPVIGDEDDYVIADPGSETAASSDHNTDSLIHFRAATAGTYYFSIESFQDQAQSRLRASYQLNVSVGPPATRGADRRRGHRRRCTAAPAGTIST